MCAYVPGKERTRGSQSTHQGKHENRHEPHYQQLREGAHHNDFDGVGQRDPLKDVEDQLVVFDPNYRKVYNEQKSRYKIVMSTSRFMVATSAPRGRGDTLVQKDVERTEKKI